MLENIDESFDDVIQLYFASWNGMHMDVYMLWVGPTSGTHNIVQSKPLINTLSCTYNSQGMNKRVLQVIANPKIVPTIFP